MRARMYDPTTGRFTSTDPVAGNYSNPQSLHKYLYCNADPINGIDPSGQFTKMELLTTTFIIGSIIGILDGPVHDGRIRAREQMAINERSSGITCLDKGVQTQRQRNLQEIDDPDFLNMTEEFYHDLGGAQKQVTYYNQRMTLTALQGIDATIHSAQIAGAAVGIIGGVSGAANQVEIIWPDTVPHPYPDGWEHWSTVRWNAIWRSMAKTDIKKIYVNRQLSLSTGRWVNRRIAPDWIELTVGGKYRIYEVVSPSQTYKELLEKGWMYKQIFGDKLEFYDILQIGQQIP
jgi:hypothetical protein